MLRGERERSDTQTASPVPLLEALWKNKLDILLKIESLRQKHGSAAFTVADEAT